MAALSDDERAILTVFADATEPLDWGDVVESLLPSRPRGPRRGGKRTWRLRWEEMVRAAMTLYKAGLLAELPTGPADMTTITDAGREALGPKPSSWITTDAVLSQEEFEAWRQKWLTQNAPQPRSSFWADLDRHLEDPEFRRSYIEHSLRIQASDEQANADGDGPAA